MIDRWNFDKRIKWLRFKPKWHYLLSHKYAPSPSAVVWGDFLCEIEKKNIVYSGQIQDYWFDEKTGALDVIILILAQRSCLELETAPMAATGAAPAASTRNCSPVDVPGDTLAIKMSEVRNINLQYYAEIAP